MTGDPYFLSEVSKTVREADFKTVFFKEHSKRVDQWAYVVADMLARKFEKRLDTLDEESRANVLQQLQLGFWPRNSFEEYFDYLCEEATSSPSS